MFILILTLILPITWADANMFRDDLKARAFFSLNDLQEAQKIWEEIQKKELTQTEREVITFNLAKLELKEGKLEDAIASFQRLQKTASPILLEEVNKNLIHAYTKLAKELEKPEGVLTVARSLLSQLVLQKAKELETKQALPPPFTEKQVLQEVETFNKRERKKEENPLKEALNLQKHAYYLLQLFTLLQDNNEKTKTVIEEAQSSVRKKSDEVIPSILQQQKIEAENGCTYPVWQQVVPLFYEGREKAYLPPTETSQRETIAFWEKALTSYEEQKNQEMENRPFPLKEIEQIDPPKRERMSSPTEGVNPW